MRPRANGAENHHLVVVVFELATLVHIKGGTSNLRYGQIAGEMKQLLVVYNTFGVWFGISGNCKPATCAAQPCSGHVWTKILLDGHLL